MSVIKALHKCPKGFRRLQEGEIIRTEDIHWSCGADSTPDWPKRGRKDLLTGTPVENFYQNAVYRKIKNPLTSAPVCGNVSEHKEKKNMNEALNRILARGTRIVSFSYSGERRNVLVGSKRASAGAPVWGRNLNRAVREYCGQLYLLGIDNLDDHNIKTFALDKIEQPCALLIG